VADADGTVTCLNAAGARQLGLDPADAEGRYLSEVLPLFDLAGREWWACTDPYGGLRTRTGQPERLLEVRGGPLLLVTARYVRDERGGPVTRLVVAFRQPRARERADRHRADLVSTVAHEIRSPLTTVKGFSATLLARWDQLTDEQKKAMLQAVILDADRVNRLLADLLDASRIGSGRLSLHLEVVNLQVAVKRVLAARAAAGDDPDRFVLEVAGPLPETWLDPDRVAQVFGNLVENAVWHGDGQITVELAPATTVDGAPAVLATVTDEGKGVDDAVRHQVFSQFWRGGRAGGSGLGLYIVKGIVEAHGGTIEVDDAPTGGAQFRVLLPAGQPPYPE
jgi:signal transduction histidine kinase